MLFRKALLAMALLVPLAEAAGIPEHLVSLKYPPVAIHAGVSGEVRLRCVLASNGDLESATVVSGPEILARAAVKNIKQWRFYPSPPASRVFEMTYRFEIDGVTEGIVDSSFAFDQPHTVVIKAPRPVMSPHQ
jgi:TonB family protein